MEKKHLKGKMEFHESIMEVIRCAQDPDRISLSTLLKTTIITENHDLIIEAWHKRGRVVGFGDLGVAKSVAEQRDFYADLTDEEEIEK